MKRQPRRNETTACLQCQKFGRQETGTEGKEGRIHGLAFRTSYLPVLVPAHSATGVYGTISWGRSTREHESCMNRGSQYWGRALGHVEKIQERQKQGRGINPLTRLAHTLAPFTVVWSLLHHVFSSFLCRAPTAVLSDNGHWQLATFTGHPKHSWIQPDQPSSQLGHIFSYILPAPSISLHVLLLTYTRRLQNSRTHAALHDTHKNATNKNNKNTNLI